MKSQMLTAIGQVELREVPAPAIGNPNDVLLKIAYVGVCGSDVHYYETGRIGSQVVQFPFTVGHECSATVVDFGSAVNGLEKGEPVVVEPAVSCWQCDQCKAGRPHTCRQLKFLGCPGQIEGCLSEYLVMPAECCFPTKEKITLQQGVLCEPFAIGVYAVGQSQLQVGQTAAILGAGPIGLSCLAAAQVRSATNIYVTEKISERIKIANNAGATWVGNPDSENVVASILKQQPDGVDIVYECAGQQETLDHAIEILKPGGKLMAIGIPRQSRVSFCPDLIRRKEISVINVRRQNHCTQKAIDLLAEDKVNLDFMITHTFDFNRTSEAFDLVANYREGVVKALIKVES
ncbi:MAG: alcohol dehydrogenase catalytic domain-containing protein [Phycisphaerae bacterium]|nr:alcohol dehydrogenase catalytic domain-containing protein [Phycisphaerae bacterium]